MILSKIVNLKKENINMAMLDFEYYKNQTFDNFIDKQFLDILKIEDTYKKIEQTIKTVFDSDLKTIANILTPPKTTLKSMPISLKFILSVSNKPCASASD
jgi:hypothetical protein